MVPFASYGEETSVIQTNFGKGNPDLFFSKKVHVSCFVCGLFLMRCSRKD